MNTQNSFNICPKCGSANGLNAKFCYQCGQRLQVPEEPATCPRCHSVNSGLANFCKSCGAPLKKENKTKLCPKCHKQVPSDQTACSCGFVFANKQSRSKNNSQQLKGRALAIVSMILLLAFVYFAFVPTAIGGTTVRFGFLTRDDGMVHRDTGTNKYAYDLVARTVKDISNGGINAWRSQGTFWTMVTGLAVAFSLSVAVHFLCSLIRIFTNKRKGKVNWFYFVMFVITAVAVLLLALPVIKTGEFHKFDNAHYTAGYELLLVPAYYLVFFVVSLFAKRKKDKNI